MTLQAYGEYGDHRKKYQDYQADRRGDAQVVVAALVKIFERFVRRLRGRYDKRIVGQLPVSDDSHDAVDVASFIVMTDGICLCARHELRPAGIRRRCCRPGNVTRPEGAVEAKQTEGPLLAQVGVLVVGREVVGRHGERHDSGKRPIVVVHAATQQDDRKTRSTTDDGLADVEQTRVPLGVQPKIFAIRNIERAGRLTAGDDVTRGISDVQHHEPAAFDEPLPDQSRQIERTLLFEFMLDQARRLIDILDGLLHVALERSGFFLGVAHLFADQRTLSRLELQPCDRPKGGNQHQAERRQQP